MTLAGWEFESKWVLAWGLPLAVLVVGLSVFRHRRGDRRQLVVLSALRAAALLLLVLLAARPIWSSSVQSPPDRDQVVLLVDGSASMSLVEDAGHSRYRQAVDFARDRLLPALERVGLDARAVLFDEAPRAATGRDLIDVVPSGSHSNLPRAIVAAVTESGQAPLAVIALTDGVTTDDRDNRAAATALLRNGVPFVGVGFGSESGPQVLALRGIAAPARVPPKDEFRIEAALQTAGTGVFPPFQLLLLRDGKLRDQKTVREATGARLWQETFEVREEQPGRHQYTVRVSRGEQDSLRVNGSEANAVVTVSDEKLWRVLFVQGGLTWDYKFIQVAVRQDPAMHITALSRTSSGSRFFQNVENDSELLAGFPSSLEQLASFRTVVLANLRPADLPRSQQDLLVKYCSDLGGGVLMLGGPETFNLAWQDSPLEQLLPVRFAGTPQAGQGGAFQLQLTDEARRSPVFQVAESGDLDTVWRRLPPMHQYAAVDSVKPGATVWAVVPRVDGPRPRVVMASQRYGAGRSGAICLPNLWRWRLAKESDPRHFDRFWQQLLRYVGGGDLQPVSIYLADQWLMPDSELRVTLEQRPAPQAATTRYRFLVESPAGDPVQDQEVELTPGRPVDVTFRGPREGMYSLRVLDQAGTEQGSRIVELKNLEREFLRTARDLEYLRQWAQLSAGLAAPVEECADADALVARIQDQARQAFLQRPARLPAGINGWTLGTLLALLSAEWLLRRRWSRM